MTRLKTNLTVLAAIIVALKFPLLAIVISGSWLLYLLLKPVVLWLKPKSSKMSAPALEIL